VGVAGCDRRAVYVLVAGVGWVLNSDSRTLITPRR
jgi:hypothetical protein